MKNATPSPLRLFHIENDDNDALLFRRAITDTRRDCVLTRFEDAHQAIAALHRVSFPEAEAPHLILTDLKLPRMSGLEFIRWLRGSRFCCLPVVLFSASTLPQDMAAAYQYGANSVAAKPDDYVGLQNAVKHLLDYWIDFCAIQEHGAALAQSEVSCV